MLKSEDLSDTKAKIEYSSQFLYDSSTNIEKQTDISFNVETTELTKSNELSDTENIINYSSQFISQSSSNIKEQEISSNIQTSEISKSLGLSDTNINTSENSID